MTAVATASPGLDRSDMDSSRGGGYSPGSTHSQYSTYSREVKYIFNPLQERNENVNADEYADYSHIVAKDKSTTGHYMAYTPHSATHTPLGSTTGSFGHNTPLGGNGPNSMTPCNMSGISQNSNPNSRRESGIISPRDESININQSNHPSRTNSVISNQSRDNRGPMSPFANEAIYSSTNHSRLSQQRLSAHLEQQISPRDANGNRCPVSPSSNMSPSSYSAKHSFLSPRNSTSSRASGRSVFTPNSGPPSYSQISIQSSTYNNVNSIMNTSNPNHLVPQIQTQHHHQQSHHNAPHHPPYPQPPNYNKRKTWSPPVLRLTAQNSRVCHSNDSLIDHYLSDTAATTASVKASQRSRSDDLDSTPPRLAPISGVLAWKPGPNVVRPIAFKPISANNMSPHSSRHPSGDDHVILSHDLARPQAVKLGTGMLGHRISPEKSAGGRRALHPIQMSSGNKPSSSSSMYHPPSQQETNNLSQHTPVPLGGFRTITINTNSSSSAHHNIPANNNLNNVNSSHSISAHSSSSHHNNSSYSHHSNHHHHPSNSSFNNSHNASATSSNSHHNTSASSSRLSCAEDSFLGEFAPRPSDRADSVPTTAANNSNNSRSWHQAGDGVLQTPSPSDSGVGELEAILREKDAEINTLREVMDRNERAILQVYEERKNAWALDTQDLKEEYERKLKIQSRKSYKTEQVLSLQVYKFQQEQKSMSEEKEKVIEERDSLKSQLEEANAEISNLRVRLELKTKHREGLESPDSNEELAIKNKEVINLHSQLHTYQIDVDKKNRELGEKAKELIGCKEEVEKLKRELDKLKNPPVTCEASSQTHALSEVSNLENVKPSMMGERERTIQTLQEELNELRTQVLGMDDRHEREKEQWLDEKNKVIRYQKQLQLNYVQMQRKNSTLETEVQQLTLELENRDMKLIALSGEESVC